MTVGLVLVVANLCAWGILLMTSPPIDQDLPDYASVPRGSSGTGLTFESCSHCPRYVVFNRGVLSGAYAPYFELLGWANVAALRGAAGEQLRYGIRVVSPGPFLIYASVQWFLAGWLVGKLKARRRI